MFLMMRNRPILWLVLIGWGCWCQASQPFLLDAKLVFGNGSCGNAIYLEEEKRNAEAFRITASVMENGVQLDAPVSFTLKRSSPHFKVMARGREARVVTSNAGIDRDNLTTTEPLVVTIKARGRASRENVFDECTNSIIITDVNDNSPVFSQEQYTSITVSPDLPVGAVVLNVSATDRDAGRNGVVSYHLRDFKWRTTQSFIDFFNVNSTTGEVRLMKSILMPAALHMDRLIGEVVASDEGDPPRRSHIYLVVEFDDHHHPFVGEGGARGGGGSASSTPNQLMFLSFILPALVPVLTWTRL